MQRSEKLSVVVATYNGAAYLAEQLESLITQTRPPDEIIFADDGSQDATRTLIARCMNRSDIPMKLVVNPTRYGYADNFLRAVAHCSSPWIAFCDQDDVWRHDKLERVSAFFGVEGLLAVSHRASILEGTRVSRLRSEQGIRRTEVLEPLSSPPWRMFAGFSLVFRRELCTQCDFEVRPENPHKPGEKLPHDEWISFLALSLGRVAVIADALVAHRHHESNASRASWSGMSMRGDARAALSRSERDLARAILAAEARATYLATIDLPGGSRAARFYRQVAALGRARRPIWRAPTLRERASALFELWAAGGYAEPSYGGTGRRELAKDALLGVLRSRGARRPAQADERANSAQVVSSLG